MKNLATSILMLLSANLCFSQSADSSDQEIKKYLVGIWEHIRSIEPNGKEYVYERKLELQENGNGICTKYTETDTVQLTFQWEVKDSTIYLYYTDSKGRTFTGDQQYITWMGDRVLEMHRQFNAAEYGKRCAYRRKSQEIITEF